MWKEIRKPLYLLLGFLALMLGAVGVLVPFLPTTPFILLAAWLFARSSRKYHLWLRDNRWFGKTLHAWESGAGMSIREKWRLVILATVFIALSFAVCPNQIGRIALVVVWFIPLSVALFSKTRR